MGELEEEELGDWFPFTAGVSSWACMPLPVRPYPVPTNLLVGARRGDGGGFGSDRPCPLVLRAFGKVFCSLDQKVNFLPTGAT